MNNIKFIKPEEDEMLYNPEKQLESFYQFCQFKNPKTNLYESRKIIFNEMNEIIKTYEKGYDSKTIKIYAKTHNFNKYKMYPTQYIKLVALPNSNDFSQAFSELLNNTNQTYGNQTVNYDV